jgi:cell division protein FtsQ
MKTVFKLLLLFALAAYLVSAFLRLSQTEDDTMCHHMKVTIVDSAAVGFINQAEVERLLKNAHLDPVGKPIESVDGKAIEDELLKNVFVKSVVCYKAAGGIVNVIIHQRKPVLRVITGKGEHYYVDDMGNRLDPLGYKADLVVVTGMADSAFIKDSLVQMGLYLQEHPFWDRQVSEVHIDQDHRATLTMRVGCDIPVVFGKLDSVPYKFRNLRVFYEEVMPNVGWNTYKEINLEYHNQIVCRRRK